MRGHLETGVERAKTGRPNIVLKILIILDGLRKRRSNASKAYSCIIRIFRTGIPTYRRQAVILS